MTILKNNLNIVETQNGSVETQDFASLQQHQHQQHQYKNKYRIPSARLQGYDYGRNGAYFVTICTKNRENFFGHIENEEMKLSNVGEIAHDCWRQISDHFPFVVLGEWVVMPNHLHGIVMIEKMDDCRVETQNGSVETQDFASLQLKQSTENKFGPQSQNLASIIRGFKIGVTKFARQHTRIYHIWQPRFHDHIIRNENELSGISEYIRHNPLNWERDENFNQP